MKRTKKLPAYKLAAALGAAALAVLGFGTGARAQIDATNWGSVTSPVYGTSQSGTYSGAELFSGPNQFGSYYSGVLPTGAKVIPAGTSIQIGMNPLGAVLTPDGKYLITTNDDEREGGGAVSNSLQSVINRGGYSVSVIDTATFKVVSQINTAGAFFIGLQVTGSGPYTVYASGGPDNSIKLFSVSAAGVIAVGSPATIAITPLVPSTAGYVSNYVPAASFNTADINGNKPPIPSQFNRTAGANITFPAGSALSPDGKYLYVACNGDNSLAIISTATNAVVKRVSVGYFPYGVSVSHDGSKILVSNWGEMAYKFLSPSYDGAGHLTSIGRISPGAALDSLFFVPTTSITGINPQTSSISILSAPGGNGATASLIGSVYEGLPLDSLYQVGDTHPSATAIVRRGSQEVLYVAKANSDSIGMVLISNNRRLPDFDLSPIKLTLDDGHKVHGAYPNALAVSPDNSRVYVAEAGINSVAVLDTTNPTNPKLLGRIPTGWYPTALALSSDGKTLYVANAKGIAGDINPSTTGNPSATGVASFPGGTVAAPNFTGGVDSNYLFGSAQKITLSSLTLDNTTVAGYNYAVNPPADTTIVPAGGAASTKIKHVIFILQENKTFDSVLGSQSGHFGAYASTTYNNVDGSPFTNATGITGFPANSSQFNPVSVNTQLLADTFATAVNYYSNSEESDAGHQFCASGTASDYTEKTLLVKTGRGLLVNKNFEPEDYPEGGYIFNNAARNGVSFKDYGAMIRIQGTDTGSSTPTTIDDPTSGKAGFPDPTNTAVNLPGSDVTSPTVGLGQSYFMAMPILQVLGTNNPTGESRLDRNYPGYNFNISDQRRAKEFFADFDRMVQQGTLPTYLYIYLPNDHTGGTQTTNLVGTAPEEVADGDVGLGMVVQHIMNSPIYYSDPTKGGDGTGSAIFMTYDDAQSTLDHIHPHRTPMIVVSPYAKPGYLGKKHYVSASIVKTEELLMGLPPNNLGDLFATDLRDLFQPIFNGISPSTLTFALKPYYKATPEGRKVWSLAAKLDTSAPDRDSLRLGALARLSMQADALHNAAVVKHHLQAVQYKATQARIYQVALRVVGAPAPRDSDD